MKCAGPEIINKNQIKYLFNIKNSRVKKVMIFFELTWIATLRSQ